MSNHFKILRPGINSTFQDLGRFGLQHLGIAPSGCMDRSLFSLSNKLVGNKVSEGVLEFAYQGPLLELVGESAFVAVSGKVNFNIINKNNEIKQGVPNESFVLSNGDKIDILSTINSIYGYLSIFGGFNLNETKGSISTLVRAKIGPNNGEKLKIDLYDLLIYGDRSNDQRLVNGDTILINSAGRFVEVYGEVNRPKFYELDAEDSYQDLINFAGGYTSYSDFNQCGGVLDASGSVWGGFGGG